MTTTTPRADDRLWLLVREQVGTDARGGPGSAPPAGGAGRAAHQVAGVLLLVRRPMGSPARRAVRRPVSPRGAGGARRSATGSSAISAAAPARSARRSRRSSPGSSRSTPRRRCCRRRASGVGAARQRRPPARRARGAADRRRAARRGDADAGAAPRAGAGSARWPKWRACSSRAAALLVVDMLPHDRESYRQQMGHVWLGFADDHMRRAADRRRLRAISGSSRSPPDAQAKGPGCSSQRRRTPSKHARTSVRPFNIKE